MTHTNWQVAQYRAPSAPVVWTAVAGVVGTLPYVVMKVYWSWGGTVGKPEGMDIADEFVRNGAPAVLVWMERHGVDFTVLLVALGLTLLAALNRPWGQVYPRWVPFVRGRRVPRPFPLGFGWAAALGVGTYGSLGMGVILTGRLHAVHTAGLAPGVFVIGFVAFFSLGVSLGVCSFSYQRRTGRRRL